MQNTKNTKSVYLVRSSENSYYKIGVAKNPTNRLKQLQTANGEKLTLIKTFETPYYMQIEISLHNLHGANKKEGEWFDLGVEEEVNFISECQRIEDNIKYLKENDNYFI